MGSGGTVRYGIWWYSKVWDLVVQSGMGSGGTVRYGIWWYSQVWDLVVK